MSLRFALPSGRARPMLAMGATAALTTVLALAPGDLAPTALRAAAAACGIGVAAFLAYRALGSPAEARRLTLVSRLALSREAGVALLEVDGRTMLLGYGAPVQILEPEKTPSSPSPDRGARS